LFATQADSRPKQTKSLQWLSHVGFLKTILAIPKQSTFIFAKRQAKINKLRCSPAAILRASHCFAHLTPFSHKRSPAAAWLFFICSCFVQKTSRMLTPKITSLYCFFVLFNLIRLHRSHNNNFIPSFYSFSMQNNSKYNYHSYVDDG
jgi:hypothetical protein